MQIVHHCTPFSLTQPPTPPPLLLLPAPPKRLCLPAPKRPAIAGLLSAPKIAGLLPAPKIVTIHDSGQHGRGHRAAPTKMVGGLDADGRGHRAAPTNGQFNEDGNLKSPDSSLVTHHSSLFSQDSRLATQDSKRVVTLEVANPLQLINIYEDPEAWWEEFERIHGRIKTIEEMDDELEAICPSYAWMRSSRRVQS